MDGQQGHALISQKLACRCRADESALRSEAIAQRKGTSMSGSAAGLGIVAIVFLAMLTLPARAAQPSFDCDGAKAEVEKMICGDDVLADLDLRLARDFARALARASADQVPELKASQRAWRAQMLKCAQTGDPRGCVLNAYTKRIELF